MRLCHLRHARDTFGLGGNVQQNVSSLVKTGEQQMVTNGAKEEHLTTWGAGAGLAGSQPHASFSLCSALGKGSASINSNGAAKAAALRGLKLSSQVK